MDSSVNITAAVFAAYLKCPTKAYLTARGENPPDTFLADTRGRISAAYKARASQGLGMGLTGIRSIDFWCLADAPHREGAQLFVDCETASYTWGQPMLARIGRRQKRSERSEFVPILYSPWEKSDQSDNLLVCLGALAIGQATGGGIPPSGKVIYGGAQYAKNVRIADDLSETLKVSTPERRCISGPE